jgi:hypothetical protein
LADFNKNLVEVPAGSNPIVLYQSLGGGWHQASLTLVVKEAVAENKRGREELMINLTARKKPGGKVRRYSSYALIYSLTGGTRNHSYVSLSALY